MKTQHFIPPVAALLIATAWLGVERRSIAKLEEENTALRKHIAAARGAGASEGAGSAAAAATTKKPDDLDWKQIADQLGGMNRNGGMPDMRAMIRIQQQIMSMDNEQLVAALDEISALDLDGNTRSMLEQFLIAAIAEKDPELALRNFIDRAGDRNGAASWQLMNALANWAKKDSAAAITWFDAEIAKGTFDSKSLDGKDGPRQRFEGALIDILLSKDPDAAGRRLDALTDDERRMALTGFSMHGMKPEDQKAFADLVRSKLPEDQQADVIANRATSLAYSGGYSELSGYLDRIDATPAERDATINRVAENKLQVLGQQRKVTQDDIEELRKWSDAQSPGSAGRATGKALSGAMNSGNGMKFSEAAAMAEEYQAAGGGDDVLVPVLENWHARENKELARELAGLISDEKRREEILEKLK